MPDKKYIEHSDQIFIAFICVITNGIIVIIGIIWQLLMS